MANSIRLLLLALVIIFASCSKETLDPNNTELTGKWKLAETLADPGDGSGKWQKVSGKTDRYIEFKANGELAGTVPKDFISYAVSDSSILTFTKNDGVTIQNYLYQLKDGFLEMSPAGPIWCIEGCGSRYIKVL
jgi:hypothetical protein